jgi:hypothetical protein
LNNYNELVDLQFRFNVGRGAQRAAPEVTDLFIAPESSAVWNEAA